MFINSLNMECNIFGLHLFFPCLGNTYAVVSKLSFPNESPPGLNPLKQEWCGETSGYVSKIHFLTATGIEPYLQWKYVLHVFLDTSPISEQIFFSVRLHILNIKSWMWADDFREKQFSVQYEKYCQCLTKRDYLNILICWA